MIEYEALCYAIRAWKQDQEAAKRNSPPRYGTAPVPPDRSLQPGSEAEDVADEGQNPDAEPVAEPVAEPEVEPDAEPEPHGDAVEDLDDDPDAMAS